MSFKLKNIVRTCMLVITLLTISILYAEQEDIIDTLYVVDSMQGTLGYLVELNDYSGGVCYPNEGLLYVGDSFNSITSYCNVSCRSFMTVETDLIPDGYHIDNANFHINQRFSTGNGGSNNFPIFYTSAANFCYIAHVNYGDALTPDNSDFFTPVLSDIGVISDTSSFGWRSLDVTNAYVSDVTAGNQYFQMMMYFHILTDYDYNSDWLSFDNAHTLYPGNFPKLIIRYVSNTDAEDELNNLIPITIYPNPAKDKLTIKISDGDALTKLQLYNTKGQIIFEENLMQRPIIKYSADISHYRLPSGIYFLKCSYLEHGKSIVQFKKIVLI